MGLISTPLHSTHGWTRLACDSLCEENSLVCARPKSSLTQACTSGGIGIADILGARFHRTSSTETDQKLSSPPASGAFA